MINKQTTKIFSVTALLLIAVMIIKCRSGTNTVSFYSTADKKEAVIKDVSDWIKQRQKILRGMEDAMGKLPEWPASPDTDMQVITETVEESYTRYSILIKAFDNEKVPAYLYIPRSKDAGSRFPAMVALHPTGALGKKIVDGEGLANRGYAKELAERGYVVIAPDYPSFGDLENYNFETDRYESGTMAAIFYHMRCVDCLTERDDVDPDRIGVIGHSLGGHNAMFLAAFDNRIKVIVSSCGWTQFENYDIGEAAVERYGGRLGPWAQDRYMPLIRDKYNLDGDKIPFNFHEIIALFAPRAFFSNSPLNDSNFDVNGVIKGIDEAQKIYRFYRVPGRLVVRYPDAEHDFPEEVRMEAYRFIDEALGH
jgi:acetyl esterase/lipase